MRFDHNEQGTYKYLYEFVKSDRDQMKKKEKVKQNGLYKAI